MIDDTQDRLQLLEEKFEYQDRTIEALNQVVIDQQGQIDELEEQLLRLKALVKTVEDIPGGGGEDPPPPHY